MKRLFVILTVLLVIVLSSCTKEETYTDKEIDTIMSDVVMYEDDVLYYKCDNYNDFSNCDLILNVHDIETDVYSLLQKIEELEQRIEQLEQE
jgi:peptidoglycan hydrolase CwlO-like protein